MTPTADRDVWHRLEAREEENARLRQRVAALLARVEQDALEIDHLRAHGPDDGEMG